ncbi:DUF4097 domain-containing protein [Streptomyces anulatus]|uniref:DUF4097 family beta strand repeat-containing protein n=1 Tax=Streptomyces anulatus TaxID=1892 RepID=UPI00224CBCD1|nr:DUF4097 family beta strand repeat-containing protein [Streptomyces anulatus]MCX4489988.1 DUF4097 domain-containing protein [Streptomyces anulatus]
MTTSQTFTANAVGAVWADIISPVGTVTVTVDPTLTHAVITVSTTDDEGPLAEAVANATHREHRYRNMECIRVDVPEPRDLLMHGGRSSYHFSGTTMVVAQNFGTIHGSVTGMVMSDGDIIVGGRRIVSNGRFITQQGGGASSITVDVQLPSDMSSVRLETTSADLTAHGDLQILDVHSVSGDIRAQGVHTLRAATTSGGTELERADARVDVSTVSGDVHIGAFNGTEARINSVSGDIRLSATPAADGEIALSTVSGDVTTRGTTRLHERISTVSGDHYRR